MEKEIERILETMERTPLLSAFQNMEEEKGTIPLTPPLLLWKSRSILQLIGGIAIGSIVATISIYIIFFVFVWLLHLEF